MKAIIVIDMQEDFVRGALGTPEAEAIIPRIVEKLEGFEGDVIFTRDTHKDDYLTTQEGQRLPIKHCIKGTPGWEIIEELQRFTKKAQIVDKKTFGATRIPALVKKHDELEFVGVCTDVCVVSNVLLLKAFYPEKKIAIDSKCCAGVTPELHEAALEVMASCQCEIL